MHHRPFTYATVALLCGACGAGEPPLTGIAEILGQCSSFLGKPVRATGYLGMCYGYDCDMAANKAEWDASNAAWNKFMLAERKQHAEREANPAAKPDNAKRAEEWRQLEAYRVMGIGGGSRAFERKAFPLQYHYVVMTGRMDDKNCDGRGGADRSPGIHPTDIRLWTPSEGAPADAH